MRFAPFTRGHLFSTALFLGLVFGQAAPATPAQPVVRPAPTIQVEQRALSTQPTSTPVITGSFSSWIGNRTRMIQVTLVAVGLGILILHKGNR
jgi:hypothetical protein